MRVHALDFWRGCPQPQDGQAPLEGRHADWGTLLAAEHLVEVEHADLPLRHELLHPLPYLVGALSLLGGRARHELFQTLPVPSAAAPRGADLHDCFRSTLSSPPRSGHQPARNCGIHERGSW